MYTMTLTGMLYYDSCPVVWQFSYMLLYCYDYYYDTLVLCEVDATFFCLRKENVSGPRKRDTFVHIPLL